MIMRTSESLNEAEWKKLCVKGIGTIKRLKRKNREVIRHAEILEKVPRCEEEKLRDPLIARLSDSNATFQPTAATSSSRGSGAEVVDLRRIASTVSVPVGGGRGGGDEALSPKSAAPGRRKFGRPPPSQVGAFEPQAFAEQPSLQPRLVLCQRSSDGSYSTISQAAYSPSPRKRPGDTSSVSTEIKAIQQTRRLLANARERTRVHTISAAFEALRKQVPCYSYGQKLSKLAILRIACNYILSLARLADLDYSSDHSNMSFSECVEQCTKTLQAEGRSKKRKE
ncbi:protein atonal homolog 8 [Carcharodon carcharias]|uniref:protein atonal homolog 8 n=1 Tax=Carcharodon carcharias TaxID=13397 RepID=UPI001B7DA9A1|nr:protein atonal homolog 8 [Carcharodon carcharias]